MNNSVLGWLDECAKNCPDKTAVVDSNGSITYKEYKDTALSIARKIYEINHSTIKKPVVVYLEKGKEVLVSFMGIAYSGYFYPLFYLR